jgi:hypothetical protein
MRGHTLYPLNLLATVHPDLYDEERRKYVGREELLELRIPLLDVLWNDALQLAPIHPRHLAAAWRTAGLASPIWEGEFFEIPVARIDAARAVWFERGALPLDDVAPFDASGYRELEQVPAAYHDYLRDYRERGRRARPFAYLPHVLVAAPLDVTHARLVKA